MGNDVTDKMDKSFSSCIYPSLEMARKYRFHMPAECDWEIYSPSEAYFLQSLGWSGRRVCLDSAALRYHRIKYPEAFAKKHDAPAKPCWLPQRSARRLLLECTLSAFDIRHRV